MHLKKMYIKTFITHDGFFCITHYAIRINCKNMAKCIVIIVPKNRRFMINIFGTQVNVDHF